MSFSPDSQTYGELVSVRTAERGERGGRERERDMNGMLYTVCVVHSLAYWGSYHSCLHYSRADQTILS